MPGRTYTNDQLSSHRDRRQGDQGNDCADSPTKQAPIMPGRWSMESLNTATDDMRSPAEEAPDSPASSRPQTPSVDGRDASRSHRLNHDGPRFQLRRRDLAFLAVGIAGGFASKLLIGAAGAAIASRRNRRRDQRSNRSCEGDFGSMIISRAATTLSELSGVDIGGSGSAHEA